MRRYQVIDGHCDTLMAAIGRSLDPAEAGTPRDLLARSVTGHSDLPRMLEGGLRCQIMALFVDDADLPRAGEVTHEMIDEFEKLCSRSGGALFPVRRGADLDKARPGRSMGALLSIEGAEALGGSLDALNDFHARGVRALGITWNRRNPFARGLKGEGAGGLTALGLELVRRLESLGMIIDVSHLSDQAFDDLARAARGPFVASHSNARAVHDAPRNLTDAQIRAIAAAGGVVGCVFVPGFVGSAEPGGSTGGAEPGHRYLGRFCDHVMHVARVGGIECAGLGSDFDGYRVGYEGDSGTVLGDAAEYPLLAEALAARGLDDSELEAVMGGNWERLIRRVLG